MADDNTSAVNTKYGILARFITALSITTLAILFKRLVIRKPRSLPYRKPESKWPRRAYRPPS